MRQLSKDILIGILFITGLVGFISGEFIISSTLFLASAIASNMKVNHKRTKADQLSWD
jgi:CheY-specific phosphatase CheX